MDGRALSELGWAAFQAGDYERARKANRDSVNATTEDRVRAASLYNLGRVAEAQEKVAEAMGHYSRSLALRPHKAVAARLSGLAARAGAAAPGGKSPVAPRATDAPCQKLFPSEDALCRCLAKAFVDDHGLGAATEEPGCEDPGQEVGRVKVVKIGSMEHHMENHYLVAKQPGGQVQAVTRLAGVYNPGAFGIYEELQHKGFTVEKLGERHVLRSLLHHHRTDRDQGISEEEGRTVHRLTVCVIPENGAVTCPLQVPVFDQYTRERIELEGGDDDLDESMRTQGLPIKRAVKLEVELMPEGAARVVLKAGEADGPVKAMLGEHRLW